VTEDVTPDFTPEPLAPEASGSQGTTLKIILMVGGLGCGCFGLVVLFGIISAIALPSFLLQANKAREAEARLAIESLNRSQQAYFLERGEFASTVEPLGVGLQPESENYRYAILPQPNSVAIVAVPQKVGLKSYVGGVFVVGGATPATVAGLCVADEPSQQQPPLPILSASQPPEVECAPGTGSIE